MFWLFLAIFAVLLVGVYLDDESRETTRQINRLADESRRRDAAPKSLNRPWLG